MRPFKGGELDEPVREPLHSHFGNLTLQLYPPLIKQDFYQQYHQPTFWPYCKSLEECVVYRSATTPSPDLQAVHDKPQHCPGLASLLTMIIPSIHCPQ